MPQVESSHAHDRQKGDLDILVVEDNPVYTAWLTGLLRHEGSQQGRHLRVIEAATLAEACQMLADRRIDAVLLDLNLPDSSGLTTIAALSATCPNLPIVVVSAIADEGIALQALSKGAQEYIFKGREGESSIFRTLSRSMERKNVELQLAQAQQQAFNNERMATIGLIASGVAHEYNNIGAVILGNVELLLANAGFPAVLRIRAERIQDAAKRGAAVTQELLSYVRGFREPEQTISLQAVIGSTWALAESTLTQCQVTGEIDAPEEPLLVRGNASILGQVLLNLIINACHAMDGQAPRRLRINLCRDDAHAGALLTVTDNGRGISQENLERIFLPFFTTKHGKGGVTSGTGLGLAVSDSFVRQHGGSIRATSQLGHGATFQVWLPLASDTTVRRAGEPQPPLDLEIPGRCALIIDDEGAIREFYEVALQDLGITTTVAASPEAVLPFDPAHLPNLVLTDWQMPGLSGRAVVEQLLAFEVGIRPAILVVSGNLCETDSRWLEGIPGLTLLAKPVSLGQLHHTVRQIFMHRRGAFPC